MSDMVIREFKVDDLKRIHEIELMSFDESYGINMFRKLHDIGTGFLVYEIESRVVAYIIFWIKDEGLGHIISLAVDKDYRRSNIASSLLNKAIETFKLMDIDKITLEVKVTNTSAVNFYKKFDFKIDREVPNYYGVESAYVMIYNFD